MAKSPNKSREPTQPQTPPSSEASGMSLDQLSQAFAAMLGHGGDSSATPLIVAGDPVLAADADDQSLPSADLTQTAADEAGANDAFPVNPRTILEAMLFVGRPDNVPLTSEQMAGMMRGVKPDEIDALVRELNTQYAAQGCPYTIASEGPGYRMALQSEFGPLRERMLGRTRAAKLSPAAIEVLALVAYNEPLTAAEVNRLRSAPSGHILRNLVRRRLLKLERGEGKPSEAKGKSNQAKYFTTPRFLEVFRLDSLADLPRTEDLARN